MDKIRLLQQRKQNLLEVGKKVRQDISALIDDKSFVELSAFSFSKNDFYGTDEQGEGVVTGYATINGFPFYIVAQNYEILSGGVSKANCAKISRCLDEAEKTSTPVIYLLASQGVQVGEGLGVMEGLSSIILKASRLKGTVNQYLIVNGEVYGFLSVLSAICDFTYFIDKKSVLASSSPFVISAKSGKNLSKFEVGGENGIKKANLVSFSVKSLEEVKKSILSINELLSERITDCGDLNSAIPELDKKTDYKTLLKIFDKGSVTEVGNSFSPEIKCLLGRIGGIAVAVTVFDGDNIFLNSHNVRKIRDFIEFVCCYSLPYITFSNVLGIVPDMATNNSLVLKEIADYVSIFDCIDTAKISVIYKKAIGAGYSLLASKSIGFDYTFAFANAEISLFDSEQGVEIEFSDEKADKQKLAERYFNEKADPINSAKYGYVDNIIQPSLVRQYLISSLQMLLKRG